MPGRDSVPRIGAGSAASGVSKHAGYKTACGGTATGLVMPASGDWSRQAPSPSLKWIDVDASVVTRFTANFET